MFKPWPNSMYEWPRKLCFADCAKFGVSKYCNPILFFISTCLFPRIQSARGGMIDPHAWVMSMNDATLPRKRLKLLGSKHPLIPDTFPKKCSSYQGQLRSMITSTDVYMLNPCGINQAVCLQQKAWTDLIVHCLPGGILTLRILVLPHWYLGILARRYTHLILF